MNLILIILVYHVWQCLLIDKSLKIRIVTSSGDYCGDPTCSVIQKNLLLKAKETGLSEERSRARACFDKRFSIHRGAANLLALIERDAGS